MENQEITGTGKIISFKQEKEYTNKYLIKYKNFRFIIYLDKNLEFEYGDVIYFNGNFKELKSAKNFNSFNYSRYLRQYKIYGSIKIEYIKKVGKEKDFNYYLNVFKIKLKQNLFEVFDNDKAGFLAGILIGDKTEILDETINDFRNSSLSHILALSGLHVVYVDFGIRFLLDLITPNQKLKNFIVIIFLIFFSIFTGGSPSCIRACIMSVMLLISIIFHRRNDFFNSLLISLDTIFIINCYNIESIGMWLSFLATFGISYIAFDENMKQQKPTLKIRLKTKIIQNIKSSLSCNLMILPVIWNFYNTVSLTFLISNFLIIFLIGPVIGLGYIHLFFGKLTKSFSFFENSLIDILFKIAECVGNLKFSRIFVPNISIIFWITYYFMVLSCVYFYRHKDMLKKSKKYIKYATLLFMVLTLIALFLNYHSDDLEIHFLDVGQGDCCLVVTPSNKTILIDGGDNERYDNGKNVVMPYLLKNGIRKLDYVIISHRRFRPYRWIILYFRKYGS